MWAYILGALLGGKGGQARTTSQAGVSGAGYPNPFPALPGLSAKPQLYTPSAVQQRAQRAYASTGYLSARGSPQGTMAARQAAVPLTRTYVSAKPTILRQSAPFVASTVPAASTGTYAKPTRPGARRV